MTDKPLPSLPELVELSARTAFTGASLVAAHQLGPEANDTALTLLAVYGTMMNTIFGRAVRWTFTERFGPFMDRFLPHYGKDPAEAQAKFEEAAKANENNPTFNDTVFRSFRNMMDATDASVAPALGSLCGVYTSQNKRPDWFFRGLGRVLCELEPGEIEDLQTLTHLACSAPGDRGYAALEIDAHRHFWAATGAGQGIQASKSSPHAFRVLALLKREQLGSNTDPGMIRYGGGSPNSDTTMAITSATVRRMFEILLPGTALPTP